MCCFKYKQHGVTHVDVAVVSIIANFTVFHSQITVKNYSHSSKPEVETNAKYRKTKYPLYTAIVWFWTIELLDE